MEIKIKKIIGVSILILVLAAGAVLGVNYFKNKNQGTPVGQSEKTKITVFYSPTCGCCKEYIAYLKKSRFDVDAKITNDTMYIKEKYQIPSEIEACHTAVIGNYFIEGHVPLEAIEKLLKEKPEIEGIALPGMPQGAPGMAGPKIGTWKIYSVSKGRVSEFLSL